MATSKRSNTVEERNALFMFAAFQERLLQAPNPIIVANILRETYIGSFCATYAVMVRRVTPDRFSYISSSGISDQQVARNLDIELSTDHALIKSVKTGEMLVSQQDLFESTRSQKSPEMLVYLPLVVKGACNLVLVLAYEKYWELTELESNSLRAIANAVALYMHQFDMSVSASLSIESRFMPSTDVLDDLDLSLRQKEIAVLIAAGQTNRNIARRLGFSEATIRYETIRLYERLRVKNRAHAAARIRDLQLK